MKRLLIANWKMNPATLTEAKELAFAIVAGVKAIPGAEVVLCPPFPYLAELAEQNGVRLGAQDCFWEKKGAYTGEVSPLMIRDLGGSYVILGHSERKRYLKETEEMTNQKVHLALEAGLVPVVCVGEQKRKEPDKKAKLRAQLRTLLKEVPREAIGKVVLVYEPEWAISSRKGAKPALPDDVAAVTEIFRELLQERFGAASQDTRILYGGSVDSKNIRAFLDFGKVEGALVGSASLDPKEFAALAKHATET